MIYVFWSDKAYAQWHCKEQWSRPRPSKIDLDSFIDCWLKGMHEDGHLVGPNWDVHNLYSQFGFKALSSPERFMEVWSPEVYKNA